MAQTELLGYVLVVAHGQDTTGGLDALFGDNHGAIVERRVLEKDVYPETRWVEGSNFADVNFKIDERTGRIIMMGAIDNVVKGAAGQAVQNMNIMFGLEENTGLKMVPMFP